MPHAPGAPADYRDPAKVLDALHFEPTRNVIYERYLFNKREQASAKTVDQYVAKLCKMADLYEHSILKEELIQDHLVIGTKDKGAQKSHVNTNRGCRNVQSELTSTY